jgi:hypothetical protein
MKIVDSTKEDPQDLEQNTFGEHASKYLPEHTTPHLHAAVCTKNDLIFVYEKMGATLAAVVSDKDMFKDRPESKGKMVRVTLINGLDTLAQWYDLRVCHGFVFFSGSHSRCCLFVFDSLHR